MKVKQMILIPIILLSFNSYAGTSNADLCEITGGEYFKNVKFKSVNVIGSDIYSSGEYIYIANVYIEGKYRYMINNKNETLLPIAEMVMMTGSHVDVCIKTNSSNNVGEVTMIAIGDELSK